MAEQKKRLVFIILAVLLFVFLGFLISGIAVFFMEVQPMGNVALIPIKGEIWVEGEAGFGTVVASSTKIVEQIKKAEENPSIKAIIFDINSPGGSPVASKEISEAVKSAKKPAVAVIREVGASGAYWIASAADYSVADEISMTGSVGVFGSYIEFAGLLERYNMTYRRLTAGEYKDLGDPFRQLQPDEKQILLEKISIMHGVFLSSVAENRNLSQYSIDQISTGEFFLGIEALELGLIDQTGNINTAKDWIKEELNITDIELAKYEAKKTFVEVLSGVISPQSFMVGRGIGSELKKAETSRKISIIA